MKSLVHDALGGIGAALAVFGLILWVAGQSVGSGCSSSLVQAVNHGQCQVATGVSSGGIGLVILGFLMIAGWVVTR